MQQQTRTRKIIVLAMLSALAYIAMVIGRVPVISIPPLDLKYDPKDIIIVIGGFLCGPVPALVIAVVVSFIEMVTVSTTLIYGLIMNIVSSGVFACTAAFIYKKKRSLGGAVIGLVIAWLLTTATMILWNYLVVPMYFKVPRAAIVGMLIPYFLPFNLLKYGLSSAVVMLVYKPVITALRKSRFLMETKHEKETKHKFNIGVFLLASFVVITCILFIHALQGRI